MSLLDLRSLEEATVGGFLGFLANDATEWSGQMKKNVGGQTVGVQMIAASDGSAFAGAVTIYVTGDAGTQAIGSVGAGACAHEGNGYHTYAPAQAETNYDAIGLTFIGSGAVPKTMQVYPSFPQTGDGFSRLGAPAGANIAADIASNFSRLGAPVGASISADIAGVQSDADNIQTRIPAALVGGRIDASVGAMAANVLTAAAIAADAITDAKVAADVTIASVTGSVGSVTGAVGSVTAGVAVTTNNDKTGYTLSAAGIQAVWDALSAALTTVGSIGKRIVDNLDGTVSSRSTYAGGAVASVTGAVGSVTGNVGGNVVGSVASVTAAVTLTAGERTAVADALLDRDLSVGTDVNSRSPRNALRFMRNKWTNAAGTLTIYKEDDATTAWTAATTSAAGDPVNSVDPA